jgi:hypothetical protein
MSIIGTAERLIEYLAGYVAIYWPRTWAALTTQLQAQPTAETSVVSDVGSQ